MRTALVRGRDGHARLVAEGAGLDFYMFSGIALELEGAVGAIDATKASTRRQFDVDAAAPRLFDQVVPGLAFELRAAEAAEERGTPDREGLRPRTLISGTARRRWIRRVGRGLAVGGRSERKRAGCHHGRKQMKLHLILHV